MYKPTNIQTAEQIEAALNEIQPFIEADYNADNITAVIERAQMLEMYLAQSSKLLADAKYLKDEFMYGEFIKAIKEAMSIKMPTLLTNKYIDTLCRGYQHLADRCYYANHCLVHQLDLSRTIISKIKMEMSNLSYQQ